MRGHRDRIISAKQRDRRKQRRWLAKTATELALMDDQIRSRRRAGVHALSPIMRWPDSDYVDALKYAMAAWPQRYR